MSEILSITNGTDEVTLIGTSSTFRVIRGDGYQPGVSGIVANWHTPLLSNGRQLKSWTLENNSDKFKLFMASNTNQDTAAGELRSLIQLLIQAINYRPSGWANTPVYLKRKADNATNTEYALIENFTLPGINSPFSYLFRQLRMSGLNLTLELGQWSNTPPGSSTAVPIGVVHTFDGVNYGNITAAGAEDHTTGEEVFFSGAYSPANITNIHIGTGGSNLINASLPTNIIGSTGSTYFGVDTSLSGSGPFSNLVFDIGLAAAGTYTLVWEYWNGSSWTALSLVNDATNNFTNTGVRVVSFSQNASWAKASPGGSLPTGYWVRCRVASGSLSTQPRQQNRRVYTVRWPHIDINSENVTGDLPALVKMSIKNVSDEGSTFGLGEASEFLIGLRSKSRGADFISQINISDEHEPSGITITNHSGSATFNDAADTPLGRELIISSTSTSSHIVSILLDRSIANQYTGRFRVFYVPNSVSQHSGETWNVRLMTRINSTSSYASGTLVFDSGNKPLTYRNYSPHDFGELHIPATDGANLKDIRFVLSSWMSGSTSPAMTHAWGRLILIPVDECAIHVSTSETTDTVNVDNYLKVNSTNPKHLLQATTHDVGNDDLVTNWKASGNGPLMLQANSDQRLHIFTIHNNLLAGGTQAIHIPVFSAQISSSQQYLTPRGNS